MPALLPLFVLIKYPNIMKKRPLRTWVRACLRGTRHLPLLMLWTGLSAVSYSQCEITACDDRPVTCGNIVKNPSFEEVETVPRCRGHLEKACCWNNLELGSSGTDVDLFHTGFVPYPHPTGDCGYPDASTMDFSPPTAPYINQPVLTSSPYGTPQTAYAGFFTYEYTSPTNPAGLWREFMHQELLEPIEPGEKVNIRFQYVLSEISKLATTFHVAFTASAPASMSIPAANRVSVPANADVNNWTTVTLSWTNTTGVPVKHLTIGNFNDNANTLASAITGITPTLPYSSASTQACYYAIDDITVEFERYGCCDADLVFINPLDMYGTPQPIYLSSLVGSILPGQSVFFDGHLIADVNYTFNNNNVRFSPQSKITVQANRLLTITNGSFLGGCNEMWYGIDATASNARVTVNGLSYIQDARTAILAQNGNTIILSGARFTNNYIGVHLRNYNGTWPLTMENTWFNWSVGLKAPYTGQHPYTGMLLENITQVSATPSGTGNQNRFIRLNNGILVNNTSVTFSNIQFNQVRAYEPGTSWALRLNNLGMYTNLYKANVNTSTGATLFQQCDNGIGAFYNYRTEITGNTFANIAGKAIWHENSLPASGVTTPQIGIYNNTITNTFMGIGTYNCSRTTITISGNQISNSSIISNSRGISMENISHTPSACPGIISRIENNTIGRHQRGIYGNYISCYRISGNTVNLLANYNVQHHGIWIESSLNVESSNNTITGNYADWQCIGIRYFRTPQSVISCNNVSTAGCCFWLDANCDLSYLHHNRMSSYKQGVFFVNQARIGPQYLSGSAAKNEWSKSSGTDLEFVTDYSITGSASPFYFESTDPNTLSNILNINIDDNGSPVTTSATGYTSPRLVLSLTGTSGVPPASVYCMQRSGRITEDGIRSRFDEYTILKPAFTDAFADAHRWMYQADLYRFLRENPGIMDESPLAGEAAQHIDSLAGTDIAQLYQVEQLLAERNYTQAAVANRAVQPSCAYAARLQEINTLLIPAWEKAGNGSTELLSEAALKRVYAISGLCYREYGESVLRARMFIQRHIDDKAVFDNTCPEIAGFSAAQNGSGIHAWPVPADDVIYVELSTASAATLSVYNMQGQQVYSRTVNAGRMSIPVKDWQPGMYILRSTAADGSTQEQKVLIAR